MFFLVPKPNKKGYNLSSFFLRYLKKINIETLEKINSFREDRGSKSRFAAI